MRKVKISGVREILFFKLIAVCSCMLATVTLLGLTKLGIDDRVNLFLLFASLLLLVLSIISGLLITWYCSALRMIVELNKTLKEERQQRKLEDLALSGH